MTLINLILFFALNNYCSLHFYWSLFYTEITALNLSLSLYFLLTTITGKYDSFIWPLGLSNAKFSGRWLIYEEPCKRTEL